MLHLDRMFLPTLSRVLLVCLSADIGLASAATGEPAFEVTPFIGYRAGGQFKDASDANINVNGGNSAALTINWRANEPGTQYELLYSRQATDIGDSAPIKLKTEYLQLGGTTIIGEPDGRVVPFAAGGFGAARLSPGDAAFSQETRWSFNLGGGVRVPLSQHVRLRFEMRGYLTWLGGDANLFCDGGCTLMAKGKTLFQYEALGGVSIGF